MANLTKGILEELKWKKANVLGDWTKNTEVDCEISQFVF